MKTFTLLFTCCLQLILFEFGAAQTPVKIWDRFFNGNFTGKDEVRSVLADDAGNVYVTGTAYHFFNGGNFSTIKYDSSGTQLWSDHYYSAQQGYFNGGKKLVMDKWGSIYAVGTLAINDGDLAVIKYGPNGRIWTINYQPYSFTTYDDFGVDIGVDTIGNFYAIAQVTSPSGNMDDLYIMKCDSAGTKLWDDNYSGGSSEDYPRSLAVSKSGVAYPALSTFNFFGSATYDIATIKYTTTGTKDWTSNYNGAGNAVDYPTMINVDDNESTYVCGTADAGATNDMVCYKQNNYGTRLWTVTYNGTASLNDTAVAVRKLPNNLVVVTGSTKELVNGSTKNAIVTMLIDSGTVLWTRKYYGLADLGATPTGMILDNNGNFVICGYEETSMTLKNGTIVCYDLSGNIVWSDSYDSGLGLADKFNSVSADPFGNIFVGGQSFTTGNSDASYLTVKYGTSGTSSLNETKTNVVSIFPNPCKAGEDVFLPLNGHHLNTPIQIFSVDGRLVKSEATNEVSAIRFTTNELSKGLYFVVCGDFTQTLKLIVK